MFTLPQHNFTASDDLKLSYCLPDTPTPEELRETIKADDRGALRRKLRNLELAVARDETLSALEAREVERAGGKLFAYDRAPYRRRAAFYRRALQAVHVDPDTLEVDEATHYNADSETIAEWCAWLEAERPRLDALEGIPALPDAETLQAKPLYYVRDVLGAMALKQQRIKRAGELVYRVLPTLLGDRRELLARRGRLMDTQNCGSHGAVSKRPQPHVIRSDVIRNKSSAHNAAAPPEKAIPPAPVVTDRVNLLPTAAEVPPLGDDPAAYLVGVLEAMARRGGRPAPADVHMEAVLDFVVTYPEAQQERVFAALATRLTDETPLAEATPTQLRLEALALHGRVRDRAALKRYRTRRRGPPRDAVGVAA